MDTMEKSKQLSQNQPKKLLSFISLVPILKVQSASVQTFVDKSSDKKTFVQERLRDE